ncbi:MAG TPA: winged helix-turn-helix transcriptional regulator [Solirubrobacterales bacterium]
MPNSFPDPPVASTLLGLGLLSGELNRSILKALAVRPMTRNDLKGWLVLKSGSSLHRQLAELQDLGLVEKNDVPDAPRHVEYRLTPAGEALVEVVELTEVWLGVNPERPWEPVSPLAWRAVEALAEAWRSTLLHRLAAVDRSQPEQLEAVAAHLGGQQLEGELQRLLGAGLLEQVGGDRNDGAYALSSWCRRGIGPLAAAGRWERDHVRERTKAISVHDAVAALLMTLPLVRLQSTTSGTCVYAIELGPEAGSGPRAGVAWIEFAAGTPKARGAGKAPGAPDAWVRGDLDAWLAAVIDRRPSALQVGGDAKLACDALHAVHEELFQLEPLHQ